MTAIAFCGDATTTTALAVAAMWDSAQPVRGPRPVVVELDPDGGSLAAWLDLPATPSLSTVVTTLHRSDRSGQTPDGRWTLVDPMIRRSDRGPSVVPAPFRMREARSAVDQAGREFLGLISDVGHTVGLLDTGRLTIPLHPAVMISRKVVLIHRQDRASTPAATARLERFAESIELVRASAPDPVVVVIGDEPFRLDEIERTVADGCTVLGLPDDSLSAAVLAGRDGVSRRRMARLPLLRAAARLAGHLGADPLEPAGASRDDRSVREAAG